MLFYTRSFDAFFFTPIQQKSKSSQSLTVVAGCFNNLTGTISNRCVNNLVGVFNNPTGTISNHHKLVLYSFSDENVAWIGFMRLKIKWYDDFFGVDDLDSAFKTSCRITTITYITNVILKLVSKAESKSSTPNKFLSFSVQLGYLIAYAFVSCW